MTLTEAEVAELEQLEADFIAADGWQVLSRGSDHPFDDAYWDVQYAGGTDRAERIFELRARRGDAVIYADVDVRLRVRVAGELMSERELRAALAPGAIARDVERCLRLDLSHCHDLGYAPDGDRHAYTDELISVDVRGEELADS